MNANSSDPRLPIVATFTDAARSLGNGWKALARETAAPLTVWVASAMLDRRWEPSFIDGADPVHVFQEDLLDVLVDLLGMASLMMIGVSCARVTILGPDSAPRRWGLWWSSSTTRFMGWTIAMSLLGTCSFVLMLPLIGLSMPTYVVVLPLIVFYYVSMRLGLVLPASATGERMDWDDSWQLTRSNGVRLGLLLLPAVFIPLYLFVRLLTLAEALGVAESLRRGTIASDVLGPLVALLTWCASMLLLSSAYRWFVSRPSE